MTRPTSPPGVCIISVVAFFALVFSAVYIAVYNFDLPAYLSITCHAELDQSPQPAEKVAPCEVLISPRVVTKSATGRVRVGERFEITFLREYFPAARNCTPPDGLSKPRDVFVANVQLLNDGNQRPQIVTEATVDFVGMVRDAASGEVVAAEYFIWGHIYDRGNHTVKLIQMYFLEDEGVDLLGLQAGSPERHLASVRFLTGFTPLKYSTLQWTWSGMWRELWTVSVVGGEGVEEPGVGTCKGTRDAVIGRWVRKSENEGWAGPGFEWRPHGCQLSEDYSCLKGKRIVLTGASPMRFTFFELCKLLGPKDAGDCRHKEMALPDMSTMFSALDLTTPNITYIQPRRLDCGPWDALKQLPAPDFMIGTCGSHVFQHRWSDTRGQLEELHRDMLAGSYWPGTNFTWRWMTTNPFDPCMDTSSWKLKVLEALPRFDAMNKDMRTIVGANRTLDWHRLSAPIMMYTYDQVHFPMWAYKGMARVIGHSLCSMQ